MTDQQALTEEWNERIAPFDHEACSAARARWNAVAKPLGSLGVLEDDIVQVAGLTRDANVSFDKRAVVVFCADNGVVAQGVSQCGPEVTRAVAHALGNGTSSVCAMARPHGIDVLPIDIGLMDPALLPTFENEMAYAAGMPLMPDFEEVPGVMTRIVGRGTGDISSGPAMAVAQAMRAITTGIDLVGELKQQGYWLLAAGEMGIGNTTTASALVAALFGVDARSAVGRGAGLSDAGLERKVRVVERALQVNSWNADDPLGALATLGGFDIAGMAGLFIGGAIHRVPVIVDGFISSVAAYVATLICPRSFCALLASHVSSEPAARLVLDALRERASRYDGSFAPAIDAGLRLGEGTGAVCLVPLLDSALAVYRGATFDQMGVEPYEDLSR